MIFTAILTALTSGAGGGLLGGLFGLFKQKQEKDERLAVAKLELARDKLEYENAAAEREHQLTVLKTSSELKLTQSELEGRLQFDKSELEGEIALDLANQESLSSAQKVFRSLKTSQGMDDYRASVRPTLAYLFTAAFFAMTGWAFYEFSSVITKEQGAEILLGLFSTLTFMVCSVGTFYFVSRRNKAVERV